MPELISFAVALAFAWLFGRAAWHKLRSPLWYETLLRAWGLRGRWPGFAVRVLGALELCCALMLLLPATRTAGLVLAALLLVAYAMGMAAQLARGSARPPCGCAGPGSETSVSPLLVARNLAIAVLAVLASLPGSHGDITLAGWIAACLCGGFLALCYAALDKLIENSEKMTGAV